MRVSVIWLPGGGDRKPVVFSAYLIKVVGRTYPVLCGVC